MENNYIKALCDTSFLDNYKYISKELYIEFIKIHINKILKKIKINNNEDLENKDLNEIEKEISRILNKNINLYNVVSKDEIIEKELEIIIYELIKQKILKNSIDNIIVLEEIDYIGISNVLDKLKLAYLYILEIEIYNYYDINKNIKNEKQKQYINNKADYSSLKQKEIKQRLIEDINEKKENLYVYNKKVGILSTYPMREIVDKYDNDILLEIYKRKYLLTLDSNLQKSSDNKLLEKNNEEIIGKHKKIFKEMLNKNKKIIEKKDFYINKLENEKELLQKDNKVKEKTIMSYANCIDEYNNLSFFKKLKNIIKKDKIKILK